MHKKIFGKICSQSIKSEEGLVFYCQPFLSYLEKKLHGWGVENTPNRDLVKDSI